MSTITTTTTRTPTIGTRETWLAAAAFGAAAADWLRLAPAPTFAIMALTKGIFGDAPQDLLCAAVQHSPLSGMVWMYMLMSTFHLAPWLKLVSGQRSGS